MQCSTRSSAVWAIFPVTDGFDDDVGDILRQRAEDGRPGYDDLLPDADQKLGVVLQERIQQLKVLDDDAAAFFDGLFHRLGQHVHLGEGGFKADVHVIGMGRVEALVLVYAENRQRPHVDAAVIVAQGRGLGTCP